MIALHSVVTNPGFTPSLPAMARATSTSKPSSSFFAPR